MGPALPLAVLVALAAFSGETGAAGSAADKKKACPPVEESDKSGQEKELSAEEGGCEAPDPSEALISLPGSVFVRNAKGEILDMRLDPPRVVPPGEAEAVLSSVRLRISDMREKQERGEKITDPGEAALARLLNAPKKASFADSGPGSSPVPRDAKALSESARRVPRAVSRVSTKAAPPPGPDEASGLKKELSGLYDQFNDKLRENGHTQLGGRWRSNLKDGYKCQLVHDTFKDLIQKRGYEKKFPDSEFVTLYQPGVLDTRFRNHVFIGVRDRATGTLTHYYDPWSGSGELKPYEGKKSLALPRAKLILKTWDETSAYYVDDEGRPAR